MARLDEEMALEAGLLAFAVMIVAAGLALLVGRVSGRAESARGRNADAPQPGEVQRQRHANINSVSPR